MNFMAKYGAVVLASAFSTTSALAAYRCQVVSQPDFFYRSIVWDGSTPFTTPLEYRGESGELKVSSIGLAGHPDYLFELRWREKTLFAVSQERNLKDYNINWRSDGHATDELISIACRSDGA